MAAWSLGSAGLLAVSRQGSAVSPEAAIVSDIAAGVIERTGRSEALFGAKAAAIRALSTLACECSEEGWDGDAAAPVDPAAVATAVDLIRAMPENLPMPELAPEPDGSVSLDWGASRRRAFSLSIGRNDRLSYAWLDGTDTGYGVERFDGSTIPPRILGSLRTLTTHGASAVRPA